MKELLSVLRLALTIFALPLMATAAVSAHQYFNDNQPLPLNSVVASAKPSMLTGTFRNHSVSIDADGVVRGRVGIVSNDTGLVGIANMKVFFVKDGKIAKQIYSKRDGSFEATGLEEGAYSFIATSGQGFAAFGVELTSDKNVETNNLIEVAAVSPNFEQVISILGDKLPAQVADEIKAQNVTKNPVAGSNRVQIVDGKLSGQLFNLLNKVSTETSVHLIKDQKAIGKTNVNEEGGFAFDNVEPGIYEFVAKGPEGIAALSFEAIQQEPKTVVEEVVTETAVSGAAPTTSSKFVSPTLDVVTTGSTDQVIVEEQFGNAYDSYGVASSPIVQPVGYAGTEIGYGIATGGCCGSAGNWGGCGGGFGGGGFGGSLGGLASLGKFAVLGWILTELFDNIDFSANDNVGPVSPAVT